MKGKNVFTESKVSRLRELIAELARTSGQSRKKKIRDKMRNIEFYISDWGINDCQPEDFENLIRTGRIKVIPSAASRTATAVPKPEARKQTADKPSEKDDTHNCDIDFKTIDNLRSNGFSGFLSVAALWQDLSLIPNIRGVYMVVWTDESMPKFRATGSGGHHRGKDPNVLIETLRTKWVEDTCVLYIGKAGDENCAATLRSRLQQYLKFGHGKSVGHRGGRYIWQIEDADNLLVCWKPLPSGNPSKAETALIAEFKRQYEGRFPFANLKS